MSCLPSQRPFDEPVLAYVAEGAGETVLLLHGSASSGAVWRRSAAVLQPLYRVISPDLIGYGKSAPWSADAPFSIDAETQALAALLPCCGQPYHLVGHSFGGAVALHLALSNPVRVRTLTLIEPVVFGALPAAGAHDAYARFATIRHRFEETLQRGDRGGAMRDFIEFWTGNGAWAMLTAANQAAMCAMAGKIALDWKAAFDFDVRPERLKLLAERTSLIRGDRSPRCMQDLVDTLHALMPGSARNVIANAGHLLPLTHSADVTAMILAQLNADAERRLR